MGLLSVPGEVNVFVNVAGTQMFTISQAKSLL